MAGVRKLEVTITKEVSAGVSDKAVDQILQLAHKRAKGKLRSISVVFASDATIRKWNKKYRKKDSTTDVLSFPYGDEADILISPKKTRAVWGPRGKRVREGLAFVLVHGYLHAIGMDHKKKTDYAKMMKLNEEIVALVMKRGYA